MLTTSQAAAQLGIQRDAVLMAVHRGILSYSEKIMSSSGRVVTYLFDEAEIQRYATEHLGRQGRRREEKS